jgi:hypothetical protein
LDSIDATYRAAITFITMLDREAIVEKFRVTPGKQFRLKDHDPSWSGDSKQPTAKRKGPRITDEQKRQIAEAKGLLENQEK